MHDGARVPLASGRQICAVLVSYHPDAGLPDRVRRILAQSGALVIVDNGSGEEALRMLEGLAADARTELILNRANLGVARALNIGIERAAALGYAWVLLFDQDSVPDPQMVETLIAVRAAFPEPGRLAVLGAGFRGAGEAAAPAGAAPWVQAESVITSGSLIELAAHARLGPFREEFFIDYVDSEYCFRARARGLLVIRTRAALMAHAIGAPTRHDLLGRARWTTNHPPDRRYYIARNDTVMLREYGGFRLGLWALKSLGRRVRTCKRIALYEQGKLAKIAAVAEGWWDGVRGRLGPRRAAPAPQAPAPPDPRAA